MVTMPIVNMPMRLASPAMMGAAPVPVPPPIPAVIKTIFVPSSSNWCIKSMLDWAASRPTSGSEPAPKPLSPKGSFTLTGDFWRD